MCPPGRSGRARAAIASRFRGNQWKAMLQITASKAASATGMACTSASCRVICVPGTSPSFSSKASSIPAAGSTPVMRRVPKRAIIASDAKPVPQPTSRTSSYRPSGSDEMRRRAPSMLWRTTSS